MLQLSPGAVVSKPVELDHKMPLSPYRIDEPAGEVCVDVWQRDAVSLAELQEDALRLTPRLGQAGLVALEGPPQGAAAATARPRSASIAATSSLPA